jgi:hypothetical protein
MLLDTTESLAPRHVNRGASAAEYEDLEKAINAGGKPGAAGLTPSPPLS